MLLAAGFGYWHWVVLLAVLGIPVAVVAGIVWLIVWLIRRNSRPTTPALDVQARLRQLDGLKAQELITQAEYEEKRAALLASV